MVGKINSFSGVGFLLFGHVKRLEMDNGVAQCRLFPELWCVQCAGLCWEFPPLCLSPDYDL